jgi:hypothetical protein
MRDVDLASALPAVNVCHVPRTRIKLMVVSVCASMDGTVRCARIISADVTTGALRDVEGRLLLTASRAFYTPPETEKDIVLVCQGGREKAARGTTEAVTPDVTRV